MRLCPRKRVDPWSSQALLLVAIPVHASNNKLLSLSANPFYENVFLAVIMVGSVPPISVV